MLKETFIELAINFNTDVTQATKMWTEIEAAYSNKNRHYHTLEHLNNLLNQLSVMRDQIADWRTILFALYFHDVVYNVLKTNNEAKSALVAEKRMKRLAVPEKMIERCKAHIHATKTHTLSVDHDTNIFTDADLSILGAPWEIYLQYYQHVRKEYALYPDFVYNPGRKKVLSHFLHQQQIFNTDYFFKKFEMQARQNLQQEITLL